MSMLYEKSLYGLGKSRQAAGQQPPLVRRSTLEAAKHRIAAQENISGSTTDTYLSKNTLP